MNVAIVTGASSGLGKCFVKELVSSKHKFDEIWVVARRSDRLADLKFEYGDIIRPISLDITAENATLKIREMLTECEAKVKLLINNAGFGKLGNFEDITESDDLGMIRLNCEALTVLSAAVLPFMPNGSEIINICSIAAFAPNARMAVYSSTKAYVMSLSRAMRLELKKRKINVLAVCPGPMDTEFLPVANISKGASHTFDTLPRVNPSLVAKGALTASKKKKAVYTNRFFYKFYRFVAKVLPHSIVVYMSRA